MAAAEETASAMGTTVTANPANPGAATSTSVEAAQAKLTSRQTDGQRETEGERERQAKWRNLQSTEEMDKQIVFVAVVFIEIKAEQAAASVQVLEK